MGEARSIEVLVSDVGQVLLPFDTSRVWERLLGATSLPEAEFRALLHELYHALDIDRRAEVGREFHAELVRRGGLRLRFEEFAWAWSDMFWEDAETIALIAGAPVRQRWLLSNTNALHWEFILRRFPHVVARFDGWIASHECGRCKPDPEIFRLVMRRTGLPPEAHLFIDDLAENVAAARALGMDGIVHTDAAALAEELARRGLAPG